MMNEHIRFDEAQGALMLLDQRFLPLREEWFACRTTDDVVYALQTMVVRGAPAIGVTAAFGCHLAAREARGWADWRASLGASLDKLRTARPTAVNLRWAVERMEALWRSHESVELEGLSALWLDEARRMQREDEEINRAMGRHGAALLADGDRVMTHCNAGALATAGFGTAVGVVYAAVEQGKRIRVVANETRPFLQGARLTAYELDRAGVEVTVACDNAAGLLMKKGLVDKIIVGADRIAANGDVANKIGTYSVALLARAHNVPFYVAAPRSTFDLLCPDGTHIPIEERTPREVTHPTGESQITPLGVKVYNFAFDVTPAELVTAIITEKGLLYPPYTTAIEKMFDA